MNNEPSPPKIPPCFSLLFSRGHLNFAEQLKQIDICALGPLRVTAALFQAGLAQCNVM